VSATSIFLYPEYCVLENSLSSYFCRLAVNNILHANIFLQQTRNWWKSKGFKFVRKLGYSIELSMVDMSI
jgi:hypothetical protein